MKARVSQWIKRLEYRIPVLFQVRMPVRYLGFDTTPESLEHFVCRQKGHPTKVLALDWLDGDRDLPRRFSLLDVGCGPGVLPSMILEHPGLCDRVDYTGIDQSETALAHCRSHFHNGYQFHRLDLQSERIPPEQYDVIVMSEVIEHLPHYREFISALLDARPRVFILTTFAVIPGLFRDQLKWNKLHRCYMNSYAFGPLYEFLRSHTNEIWLGDLGTQTFDRHWFPRKSLLAFYLRLNRKKVIWTRDGWRNKEDDVFSAVAARGGAADPL